VPFSVLLTFSSFVFFPKRLGDLYVILLAFLRTSTKQDHDAIAITSKINAVSGAKVNSTFQDAPSNAFGI